MYTLNRGYGIRLNLKHRIPRVILLRTEGGGSGRLGLQGDSNSSTVQLTYLGMILELRQ